jgi:hypothetical protein
VPRIAPKVSKEMYAEAMQQVMLVLEEWLERDSLDGINLEKMPVIRLRNRILDGFYDSFQAPVTHPVFGSAKHFRKMLLDNQKILEASGFFVETDGDWTRIGKGYVKPPLPVFALYREAMEEILLVLEEYKIEWGDMTLQELYMSLDKDSRRIIGCKARFITIMRRENIFLLQHGFYIVWKDADPWTVIIPKEYFPTWKRKMGIA